MRMSVCVRLILFMLRHVRLCVYQAVPARVCLYLSLPRLLSEYLPTIKREKRTRDYCFFPSCQRGRERHHLQGLKFNIGKMLLCYLKDANLDLHERCSPRLRLVFC